MKKLTTLFAALLYSTAAFSQAGGVYTGPNQPGQQIGTGVADNAQGGNVGEYFPATGGTSGTPLAMSNGVALNVASLPLTAGDWDVSCTLYFTPAATTTTTFVIASLGTTNSAVNNSVAGQFSQVAPNGANGGNTFSVSIPRWRVSQAGTASQFCNAYSAFGTSTLGVWGIMTARRVR